MDSFEGGLM